MASITYWQSRPYTVEDKETTPPSNEKPYSAARVGGGGTIGNVSGPHSEGHEIGRVPTGAVHRLGAGMSLHRKDERHRHQGRRYRRRRLRCHRRPVCHLALLNSLGPCRVRPLSHRNRIDCPHIPLAHRSSNDYPFLCLWFLVRAKDSVVGDVPAESISVRLGTNSVAYTRIILADREKAKS